MRLHFAIGLCAVVGCGADPVERVDEPTRAGPPGMLELELLQSDVQPMFDRLCAQTACHGDPARRLFLFSSFGTRLGSELTPLSDDELRANLEACRGFLDGVADVTRSELLSRPLRPEAGGSPHGGGDQFYDRGDPSYVLLACWLTGGRYEALDCQP